MSLIIRDVLVGPPTSVSVFRDLTLYCGVFLDLPTVVETDDPDPYYRWLRSKGGMDFVQDFVRPNSERGVRIDTECRFGQSTVLCSRIVAENLHFLIASVRARIPAPPTKI